MKIRRPEHPLVYMKSAKLRKHDRKRSRLPYEAVPQLTINALLLPNRYPSSAPILTEADGAAIIDITDPEEIDDHA